MEALGADNIINFPCPLEPREMCDISIVQNCSELFRIDQKCLARLQAFQDSSEAQTSTNRKRGVYTTHSSSREAIGGRASECGGHLSSTADFVQNCSEMFRIVQKYQLCTVFHKF